LKQVVLCYHAVSPTWEHRLALPPKQLLRQIRAVRRFRHVHVTFDDAFRSITSVLPDLQRIGVPVTVFVCSGFADLGGAPLLVPELETDDPDDVEGLRTMSWDELRALPGDGVTVGSHTVTHPHLPRLSDRELAKEVGESRERIEAELGRPCPLLAYPYGEHDERVQEAVRAAGYETAFGLGSRRSDEFATARVDLYRRDTVPRTVTRAFLSGTA
jgi:peptidoglycan/xylan/chitin deacetylase (PgdA/CDA1 family)